MPDILAAVANPAFDIRFPAVCHGVHIDWRGAACWESYRGVAGEPAELFANQRVDIELVTHAQLLESWTRHTLHGSATDLRLDGL